jgi:hypothetical protein
MKLLFTSLPYLASELLFQRCMATNIKSEAGSVLPKPQQCPNCGVPREGTDERVRRLQEEVERLRFELAVMTGQLVSENRLPC